MERDRLCWDVLTFEFRNTSLFICKSAILYGDTFLNPSLFCLFPFSIFGGQTETHSPTGNGLYCQLLNFEITYMFRLLMVYLLPLYLINTFSHFISEMAGDPSSHTKQSIRTPVNLFIVKPSKLRFGGMIND